MELSPTLKKTADKYIKQNKDKYIAKGKKAGIAEALLESAKRMIKKGVYSLEEIAENLNLPLNEVQTISAQMAWFYK